MPPGVQFMHQSKLYFPLVLRQHEEDIEIIANQVGIVCSNVSKAIKQDDARVILALPEIKQMIETVESQQKQFSEVSLIQGHR